MNRVQVGRLGLIFGQNRSHGFWEGHGKPPGAQNGHKKSKIQKNIENSKIGNFVFSRGRASYFPGGGLPIFPGRRPGRSPIKFAAPPPGEQGVMESSRGFASCAYLRQAPHLPPTPARRPQIRDQNSSFFRSHFQPPFWHPKIRQVSENGPQTGPHLEAKISPSRPKMSSRTQHKNNTVFYTQHDAKIKAQDSQKQQL